MVLKVLAGQIRDRVSKIPPAAHRPLYPIPAFRQAWPSPRHRPARQVRPRCPGDASQMTFLAGTAHASTDPLPRAVTPIPCRMPGIARGRVVHWAVRGTATDDAGRGQMIIIILRAGRERCGVAGCPTLGGFGIIGDDGVVGGGHPARPGRRVSPATGKLW